MASASLYHPTIDDVNLDLKPAIIAWWIEANDREGDLRALSAKNVTRYSLILSIKAMSTMQCTVQRAKMYAHLVLRGQDDVVKAAFL